MLVKAFGKTVEFPDGTKPEEVKRVVEALDPDKGIKRHEAALEAVRGEIDKAATKTNEVIKNGNKEVCEALSNLKTSNPKTFKTTKTGDGEYLTVLNY